MSTYPRAPTDGEHSWALLLDKLQAVSSPSQTTKDLIACARLGKEGTGTLYNFMLGAMKLPAALSQSFGAYCPHLPDHKDTILRAFLAIAKSYVVGHDYDVSYGAELALKILEPTLDPDGRYPGSAWAPDVSEVPGTAPPLSPDEFFHAAAHALVVVTSLAADKPCDLHDAFRAAVVILKLGVRRQHKDLPREVRRLGWDAAGFALFLAMLGAECKLRFRHALAAQHSNLTTEQHKTFFEVAISLEHSHVDALCRLVDKEHPRASYMYLQLGLVAWGACDAENAHAAWERALEAALAADDELTAAQAAWLMAAAITKGALGPSVPRTELERLVAQARALEEKSALYNPLRLVFVATRERQDVLEFLAAAGSAAQLRCTVQDPVVASAAAGYPASMFSCANPTSVTELGLRGCDRCNQRPVGVKLSRCSGCRQRYYCGVQCQKADWPQHRAECKARQRGSGVTR